MFEDFVSAALREAFKPYGGVLVSQYASTLDVEGTVKIAPDLVCVVDGVVRARIDVKYKVEKHGQYPNADLCQMAAYCRRFGFGFGFGLGRGRGARLCGRLRLAESVRVIEGPKVTRTIVALDADRAELFAQTDRFASRVVRSVCPVLPLR